jgi:hypothetical protein
VLGQHCVSIWAYDRPSLLTPEANQRLLNDLLT